MKMRSMLLGLAAIAAMTFGGAFAATAGPPANLGFGPDNVFENTIISTLYGGVADNILVDGQAFDSTTIYGVAMLGGDEGGGNEGGDVPPVGDPPTPPVGDPPADPAFLSLEVPALPSWFI
jgi:hypothetical protein